MRNNHYAAEFRHHRKLCDKCSKGNSLCTTGHLLWMKMTEWKRATK